MRDDMVTLHSPVTAEQLAHRPWREVIGPIHPDDPELHREHEETTA